MWSFAVAPCELPRPRPQHGPVIETRQVPIGQVNAALPPSNHVLFPSPLQQLNDRSRYFGGIGASVCRRWLQAIPLGLTAKRSAQHTWKCTMKLNLFSFILQP